MTPMAQHRSARTRQSARRDWESDQVRPMVYVIDDEPADREALRVLLETVSLPTRCFADAESFLVSWESSRPGCLILDLRLPRISGLEVQTWMQERGVDLPIIFLTAHGTISTAVRAMRAGALQFLTKPVDEDELLEWVRIALVLDTQRRRDRREHETVRARLETLTVREQQVLDGILAARTNKEIARDLGISPKTVDVHRTSLMSKMQVHSSTELMRICIEAGTLPSPKQRRMP